MTNLLACILLLTLLAPGAGARPDGQDVALEAAIQKEVVDGDLQGAIRQYDAVAHGSNRAAAAKALLRMGQCYTKLGDAQAAAAYERVVKDFGDQKEAAAEARARLAALPAAHEKTAGVVGWYGGAWQSGVPGLLNWYVSESDFARVYDEFVVPQGGWTVVGAFSSNALYEFPEVTRASWEIRSGMGAGALGKVVASGISPATLVPDPAFAGTRAQEFGWRVVVQGLHVQLAPGQYWLSVTPCGTGKVYASSTVGKYALGQRGAEDALFVVPGVVRTAESIGARGQIGIARHFSQGVIVAPGAHVAGPAASVFLGLTGTIPVRKPNATSAATAAQTVPLQPGTALGWFNGDWEPAEPVLANWFLSKREYARVYDDFVVPEGGWTVTGVFSNNRMDFPEVQFASWEIRSGVSAGQGGKLVASGISPATATRLPGYGPFPGDSLIGYRVQVDGLQVALAPGRYWLSVAPCGKGRSNAGATHGRNAVGVPAGAKGGAFFSQSEGQKSFVDAARLDGSFGIGMDYAQGVLVAAKK